MPAHFVIVVCLSVALAISLGANAALIVMLRRCGDALHRTQSLFRDYREFRVRGMRGVRTALQRTESVFRKYREFHVRRMREARGAKSALSAELQRSQQERSLFLARWKESGPKVVELSLLCDYWESETHYWRKKCWWHSDKRARERDRDVVRAAVESAGMEVAAGFFAD